MARTLLENLLGLVASLTTVGLSSASSSSLIQARVVTGVPVDDYRSNNGLAEQYRASGHGSVQRVGPGNCVINPCRQADCTAESSCRAKGGYSMLQMKTSRVAAPAHAEPHAQMDVDSEANAGAEIDAKNHATRRGLFLEGAPGISYLQSRETQIAEMQAETMMPRIQGKVNELSEQEPQQEIQKVTEVYPGKVEAQNIYCYLKAKFFVASKQEAFFPELSKKSCALVSTSGALLAREHGADIDSHDIVIRFHRSPVAIYSENVGTRTDISLDGTHEGIDFDGMGKRARITGLQNIVISEFGSLYPKRMGMHDVPGPGEHDPTTGSKGVLTAIANCIKVDAYEMTPSKDAGEYPYHYYDVPEGKTNIKADDNDWHGMIKAEHDLWRRISIASASDHDSGKTSYPGFSTVECPSQVDFPGVLGLLDLVPDAFLHIPVVS